jgi:hypothetical protein
LKSTLGLTVKKKLFVALCVVIYIPITVLFLVWIITGGIPPWQLTHDEWVGAVIAIPLLYLVGHWLGLI